MKTNHHQLCMALLAVTVLASTAPADIMVFDNYPDFADAVGPELRIYSFDGWTDGNPLDGETDWLYGDEMYAFHAHADLGLRSKPGALSTVNAYDPLVFTFENSPLEGMSFGGWFASGDSDGNIINQDLSFTVTDGLNDYVEVTLPGGSSQFRGFLSYDGLTQVTVNGVDDPNPNWPLLDQVFFNSPEPTTLVLLALGGLLLRRRKSA